jgi:lysozyme
MFILKDGARGQEVTRLQRNIQTEDDGIFGSKTKEALKSFQKYSGLFPDGIYGIETQTKMNTEIWPGIDVSSHQGDIDWERVSKSGIKFAFVKLTEGRTHNNPKRKQNWDGAKSNNIIVGAYHFARPDTDSSSDDAVEEAKHYIRALKEVGWERGVDFAPVLDLEAGNKSDDEYNADWAIKFCEVIESELKVRPIIYTAKWFWDSYLRSGKKDTLNKLVAYPVWWAHYTTNTQEDPNLEGWSNWNIWQWTGSGRVDGISGKVDKNWLPGGQLGIEKLMGIKKCNCSGCCTC